MIESILEILQSPTVITVIIGALVMGFAKTITRIFRMGATFKNNLVSRDELNRFEAEMRKDMRAYATQIQKAVMDATLKVIDNRLREYDNLTETVQEMKVLKVEIENEVEKIMERSKDVAALNDSVRSLSNKVSRLEYSSDTKTSERRTENR